MMCKPSGAGLSGGRLSGRRRAAIVGSLAMALWGVIVGAVFVSVHLVLRVIA